MVSLESLLILGELLKWSFYQSRNHSGDRYSLLSIPIRHKQTQVGCIPFFWLRPRRHTCVKKALRPLFLPLCFSRSDDTFCPLLIVARRVSSAWEQVIRVWKETDHPSLSPLSFPEFNILAEALARAMFEKIRQHSEGNTVCLSMSWLHVKH